MKPASMGLGWQRGMLAVSISLALAGASSIARGADVQVNAPSGGDVVIKDSTGTTTLLQVQSSGPVTVPNLPTAPTYPTGVCFNASGVLGQCATSSSGLGAYGSFSLDSGPIVAVILAGTSLPLSTTTASLNITYSGTTATIANAGVYRMSYCVRMTSTVLVSSRLLVNGAGVTSSAISPPQGADTLCRSTTLSLAAGTTVDLQLYANPPVAPTLLSPGGAELLIEQLGPLVP